MASVLAKFKYISVYSDSRDGDLAPFEYPIHIVCNTKTIYFLPCDPKQLPNNKTTAAFAATALVPVIGIAVGLAVGAASLAKKFMGETQIGNVIETDDAALDALVTHGMAFSVQRSLIFCTKHEVGASLIFLERPTANYVLESEVETANGLRRWAICLSDIRSPSGNSNWASEVVQTLGLRYETKKFPGIKGILKSGEEIRFTYPFHRNSK